MILIVSSQKDIASQNIKQQIMDHYPFRKTDQNFQQTPIYSSVVNSKNVTMITLEDEAVEAQDLPQNFPLSKLIVFISRHSSQSGKPTLSVHTPGNFGDAELGGLPKVLSVSSGCAMVNALKALARLNKELCLDYDVSFECTHHGPSLNVPTLFVELGSSLPQWSDLMAAKAVAHAAMDVVTNFGYSKAEVVLGIGGTHYNQKFTQMALADEAVFTHMVPKYAVSLIDAEMLSQCVRKSLEMVSCVLLDWKGIKSEDKPGLLAALKTAKLPYRKV